MNELARRAWRDGICPQLSTAALQALATALRSDDERLLQGATTSPPPLQCVADWDVEAACALGYCGWQTGAGRTVVEVQTYFARLCFECDERIGESAFVRNFLDWFDDTPRSQMRRELLAEVNLELQRRAAANKPVEVA